MEGITWDCRTRQPTIRRRNESESESRSVVSDSLWPHGLSSWNSPGQNTGVGSLSLLQGLFPTQGSNPGLPLAGALPVEPQRKPKNTGVGSLSLLQGIRPTQELNPGSPELLEDSLPAKLWGKPQWITRLLESSSGGRWGQDSGGRVCRDKLLCSLTASWGAVPSGQGAWNNPWICTRGNIGEGGKVVCLPFPSLARFWRTGKVNQSFAEDSIISPGNKSFLWSLSSPYFCQHLSGLHLLNLLSG